MSQPIIMANRAKNVLREGQSVIGTMVVEIRQPSIMQLLAIAKAGSEARSAIGQVCGKY